LFFALLQLHYNKFVHDCLYISVNGHPPPYTPITPKR